MTLEERYKSSSDKINPTKYSEKTQFNKDTSLLNIDSIPAKYNTAGKLTSLPDTSRLNIDSIPTKYHG